MAIRFVDIEPEDGKRTTAAAQKARSEPQPSRAPADEASPKPKAKARKPPR